MRTALAALGLSTCAFSAGAGGPPPSGPHSFMLANGLTVVVIEDHRAPVVTQMVWYRVGSADDPTGQSGLAHFLVSGDTTNWSSGDMRIWSLFEPRGRSE
jgi:zinc protease